jgi:glycerol-3-phosphate cytidylyltransferase-like family protein
MRRRSSAALVVFVPMWHPESLDTRSKIIDPEQLPADRTVVVGLFDPVTVAHVRRLLELRERCGNVTVLLADPPEPILPARARAEVLAALNAVDFVLLPQEHALSVVLQRTRKSLVFREENADQGRFETLVNHIHQRHTAAAQR